MANEGDVEIATHNHKLTPTYDVFLCFRGVDTRHTFTRKLFDALCKKKIETFKDDDDHDEGSKMGEDKAILEESRIVIVVFSKDFASSSYCLDQLVKIFEYQDKRSQQVLPIFYDVDPSDVRCETDNSSYKLALVKLQQQKFPNNPDKIAKWKLALSHVASTTTSYEEWQLQNGVNKSEYERINKIVKWVMTSTLQDVFLSFSGNNTGDSIVGMLLDVLKKETFKIHMPIHMHDIEKSGNMDRISESLTEAIHKSRLSIIVLCENYASSPLCLDELVTILECKEMKKQQVHPIFYKVKPLDITSFGIAMAEHEQVFGRDSVEVQTWRKALNQVTNLGGYHVKIGDKKELCQIVRSILEPMNDVSMGEKSDSSLTEKHKQKRWRYDVFLSFNGSDTRESFTGYLYYALRHEGFKTFANEKAHEMGDKTIRESIGESRIVIVILSKKYTSSCDCLQELAMILDCKKRNDHHQQIFAIHYGVDPSYDHDEGEKLVSDLSKAASWIFKIGNVKDQHDDDITKIVKQASEHLPCYDVFLSFSEKDYCCSFTDFLLTALQEKGFKRLIKDHSSQSPADTEIAKSRLSIIILSQNYVHSPSCLDQLVTIIGCMNDKRQLVWPIFLKIDPSDLKISFEKTLMIQHDDKVNSDQKPKEHFTVDKWRSAISEVAKLKFKHLKFGHEYEIIQEIVEKAIEI